MSTMTLNVEGMSCGGCVSGVTNILKATPGVSDARVSLNDKRAVVEMSAPVDQQVLIDALGKKGYTAMKVG
ncbi:heavy-metal-associated domain-containing protein [soil metagenome]